MKKLLLSILTLASLTAAHANSYFPALGDNKETLQSRYGQPSQSESSRYGLTLTWTTKDGYDIRCEFDNDAVQSVQIRMTNGKMIPIHWMFEEMFWWTDGIKYDDWQEVKLEAVPAPDGAERIFVGKNKAGKLIEVSLYPGGTSMMIISGDWIDKLLAEKTPKVGGVFQVEANSMWFESKAELISWIRTKPAHQQELLNHRISWQFVNEQRVRVREYLPQDHLVKVERLSEGPSADHRFDGMQWWVEDADIK